MKVNRTEQQFISKSHPLYEIVDKHCFYSKNVYNQANYLMRQSFTKENKVLSGFEIQKLMQNMDCYKECGSQAAQKTIQMQNNTYDSPEWVEKYKIQQKIMAVEREKEKLRTNLSIYQKIGDQTQIDLTKAKIKKLNEKNRELKASI